MSSEGSAREVGARTWVALWVVYLIWGSTYLAIRIGVAPTVGRGVPPLLLAGIRFTIAGLLMLAFTLRPGDRRSDDPVGIRQWVAGGIVGLALLLGGNGLVSLGERTVNSGTAALVVASVPILAAVMSAAIGRERFTTRRIVGLVIGLCGVGVLSVGGGGSKGSHLTGVLIVLAAAVSWSAGSVYGQTAPLPRRPLVATGIEMVVGGIGCLAVSAASGEWGQFSASAVPARSWWALGYLIVAGAMVAYTAYAWLLSNAPLSLTTTYAYVNPVVAVILGALILGEPFGWRSGLATLLVVGGVGLVLQRPPRSAPPEPARPETEREPVGCGPAERCSS